MFADIDIAGLIDRLQDHALTDPPGPMSESQVDAAIALLDRVLPDLHRFELTMAGRSLWVVEARSSASKVEGE